MAKLPWSSPVVDLREAPPARQIGMRLRPPFPADLAGLALPPGANRVTATGAMRVLWLGPDEWLVVADGEATDLPARLSGAAGSRAAVTDLSSSRTIVEIGGSAARDLLAAGCGLDLHPRAFAAGHCAQTLVARVPVILDQLDDAPRYRLLVRRSYAAWLIDWLIDASHGLQG
ncbi:MAG TPA: sarcosine oxidase subunit gamma family protein [Stellaceae bacterium]|nr:sarcosine oxidase subunit gamma family protein [Stellaceae bacterium]